MNSNTFLPLLVGAEKDGLVQRTFRRLDLERQDKIINAILVEASEVGPENIRIQEVASRAEVSTGSMYQYFPDRDRLLDFAVHLCLQSWVDLFDQYRDELISMPFEEGIKAYLLGGIEMGEYDKGVVLFFGKAVYQNSGGRFERAIELISQKMLEMVRDMIVQAQGRNEISSEIDIEATARVINTHMIALGDSQLFPYLNKYYKTSDADVEFLRVVDAATHLIMHGLKCK